MFFVFKQNYPTYEKYFAAICDRNNEKIICLGLVELQDRKVMNLDGVVWHLSLPLMNSFNKTEAAVFSFRPCFLRASLSSV